ncbi:type II toxin-antitoxin system PemK/MazF family toxin [Alicyclobacillus mali]|uniref:Type II toxin-antitoxin system PemK/MazF family toxin n=1 Tax=Alicyclobacillus mali (ex Roth et al. 2021) TaxID=1123961 RepID=A0ABS0F5B2_9BACL|nr:type II toxin-antitoxin system PemK/MazF family toxin [Alicyclobacillus mali (ex Roth et al. 2021)]MBF8378474.1 type II toxin-antitoxin system PemK/MazF family toxin [Alicyclobacillus mali (ex Roth et al. 2021)]
MRFVRCIARADANTTRALISLNLGWSPSLCSKNPCRTRTRDSAKGSCICCPITSKQKGYPFEVVLGPDVPVQGVVLADQVRSLDWRERSAQYIGRVSSAVLHDVIEKIRILLESQ